MSLDIVDMYKEVQEYVDDLSVDIDGEHLWTNYQLVTARLIRMSQIRNDLAFLEVTGRASAEAKKFRTLVLDPTIDRFEKVAAFESRKITARGMESQLEK